MPLAALRSLPALAAQLMSVRTRRAPPRAESFDDSVRGWRGRRGNPSERPGGDSSVFSEGGTDKRAAGGRDSGSAMKCSTTGGARPAERDVLEAPSSNWIESTTDHPWARPG